jgi:hypothetical protein
MNQRVGERGDRAQSWVENTNMTDCTSDFGALWLISPCITVSVSMCTLASVELTVVVVRQYHNNCKSRRSKVIR